MVNIPQSDSDLVANGTIPATGMGTDRVGALDAG